MSFMNIIRLLLTAFKGPYYRRHSQYNRTGKIALCCIVKLENDYIRFFVEYYRSLHFDKIILYDNNDPNGERLDEVIGDYIQSNYVEIVDFRGREVAQLDAYQDCYNKYNNEYDWIAFFDCDEFLAFSNEDLDDIHNLLEMKRFLKYQLMHVNWKVYGDNNMLDNDGRNVVERFIKPIMPLDFIPSGGMIPENCHVKSIVRGGLKKVDWHRGKNPHTINSSYFLCCNPNGDLVDVNSPYMEFDDNIMTLHHYSTKTIGEWINNKMKRGIPDRNEENWQQLLNIDFFFRYNEKTEEKVLYAEKLLKKLAYE